jgi:hypothetical protein
MIHYSVLRERFWVPSAPTQKPMGSSSDLVLRCGLLIPTPNGFREHGSPVIWWQRITNAHIDIMIPVNFCKDVASGISFPEKLVHEVVFDC